MKQLLLFMSLVFAVTFGSFAQSCDTVQIPYTADFTQCWTPSGGATVVDSNHLTFTHNGQQVVGPWMDLQDGALNYWATITHNPSAPSESIVWLSLEREDGVNLSYGGITLWDTVVFINMNPLVSATVPFARWW